MSRSVPASCPFVASYVSACERAHPDVLGAYAPCSGIRAPARRVLEPTLADAGGFRQPAR
ncbi:hypothetical protein IEE94_13850 [Yimella sp. cx-573]|nr:hypothetical protein [Yimella sp. cx-573]